MKTWQKWTVTVLLFIGFLVLLNVLPLQEWVKPFFSRLEEMGWIGGLLFVLIGIGMTLLFVPVTVLITLSGFFFGLGWGLVTSFLILSGGLSLGNLLGALLWPKLKQASMFQNPIFQAVREVIETSGLWMISLLRMSPFFHFMTGNLFLGSLKLNFFPYLGYSLLGMVPGTVLVVMAGDLASQSVQADSDLSAWKIALFIIGAAAFAVLSGYIAKRTRKVLDEKKDGNEKENDSADSH
jgi:uncharacterized membrane protein YdjX (TVP38/TMEM64 family)